MKLKLDDAGHVVVQEGKPVYVADDGKETAIDVAGTVATITRLNGEAATNRKRAETAEGALKAFDGITDPAAAIKALGITANLDAKKLIDAGEVDRLKADINKVWQDKYDTESKRAASMESALYGEMIGGSFARSKMIADKLAIPPDMVQARFGSAFKIEDGKVVAYRDGNKITSRAKPGENADFDEALEILVSDYPHRDSIMKGNANGGSGARQGAGGGGGANGQIPRAQFDAMGQAERMKAVQGGATIVD